MQQRHSNVVKIVGDSCFALLTTTAYFPVNLLHFSLWAGITFAVYKNVFLILAEFFRQKHANKRLFWPQTCHLDDCFWCCVSLLNPGLRTPGTLFYQTVCCLPTGPSLPTFWPVAPLQISTWKENSLHPRTCWFLPIWSTYTPRPWLLLQHGSKRGLVESSAGVGEEAGTFLGSISTSFKPPLKVTETPRVPTSVSWTLHSRHLCATLRVESSPVPGGVRMLSSWGSRAEEAAVGTHLIMQPSWGRKTREDGWREFFWESAREASTHLFFCGNFSFGM